MVLPLVNSPIKEVSALAQDHLITDLPDTVTTNISFENGIKARVYNSWFHPKKEQKFTAIGETGSLIFDDTQGWDKKLVHIPHSSKRTEKGVDLKQLDPIAIALPPAEPLKIECEHFIKCLENGEKPLTHVENAIVVMDLLQKAQDSIDCNRSQKRVEQTYLKVANS